LWNHYSSITTYSCNSYAQARLSAARTRARVALALLGQYNHDTECTLSQRAGSARDLVRAALENIMRARLLVEGEE
jgi:hypothetical protein